MPLDITWADPEENLLAVADRLSHLRPDTDVLVLPELFTSGFITDEILLRKVAEQSSRQTLPALMLWAKRFNIAVAGSFLTVDAGRIYNRGFFIEPSGETTFYDKAHLFSLSSESRMLAEGNTPIPTVRFRGWNFSLAICYDLRFPVWCRNAEGRYDILLVPANWPSAREYAWRHLLIARSIENQAVVVGVNRSGKDDFGEYDNMTFAYGAQGEPLIEDTRISAESPFVYVSYTKENLDKLRRHFPFLEDADKFRLL